MDIIGALTSVGSSFYRPFDDREGSGITYSSVRHQETELPAGFEVPLHTTYHLQLLVHLISSAVKVTVLPSSTCLDSMPSIFAYDATVVVEDKKILLNPEG